MDNNMADNGKLPVRRLDLSNSECTVTGPECSENVTCRRQKQSAPHDMSETGESAEYA